MMFSNYFEQFLVGNSERLIGSYASTAFRMCLGEI
jgi:hypothetical protein